MQIIDLNVCKYKIKWNWHYASNVINIILSVSHYHNLHIAKDKSVALKGDFLTAPQPVNNKLSTKMQNYIIQETLYL